jgi:hypothetical protein
MAQYHIYTLSPIDDWDGWNELHETSPDRDKPDALWELLSALQQKARTIRYPWEGDCSQGPFWLPLPADTGNYLFLFAWKQSNNGTTFVASPVELPWLDQIGHHWQGDIPLE